MIDVRRLWRRPRLHVGWFVPVSHRNYDRMPASVWIRCLQLVRYLEQQGIACSVNDADARPDVAVFVRRQDAAAFDQARALRARGTKIVFDLCVNYFDEAVLPTLGAVVTPQHVADCLRMLSVADAVATASTYIADRARAHHGRVVCLPDSIDPKHFTRRKEHREFTRRPMTAVWSGVGAKAVELEPVLPLLARHGIQLTLICETPPRLTLRGSAGGEQPFPYTFVRWSYDTFPRDLLNGEFCLGYRGLDNPYNAGHSHFKIGVFLACGIPAVASPIPSYVDILRHHRCGATCDTLDQWAATFEAIAGDPAMLASWSREAPGAMAPYATDTVAAQYAALFLELTDAGSVRTESDAAGVALH